MKKTLLTLSIAAAISSVSANPLEEAQYETSDFYTTYFSALNGIELSREDLLEASEVTDVLFTQDTLSLNEARLDTYEKAIDKWITNRHHFDGQDDSPTIQAMDQELYDLAIRTAQIEEEAFGLDTATRRGDALRAAIPKYEGIIAVYKRIHANFARIPSLSWLADIFQRRIDRFERIVAKFRELLEIEEAIENPPPPVEEKPVKEEQKSEETTSKSADNSSVDFRTAEFNRSGLQYINADAAYKQGWTGKGVTVAVLDTGVDPNAPINMVQGYDAWNGVVGQSSDTSSNGHGTHVAGIIAAKRDGQDTHGVAFEANVLPIRIANESGSLSYESARAGLKYAVGKAKTANLSFGGKISTTRGEEYIKRLFRNEYIDAINADLTLVVAAGNSGLDCLDDECTYPAALPTVKGYEGLVTGKGGWITVGSVGYDNKLSNFSNKAGKMKDFYMVAHGHYVLSTKKGGGTTYMSGTSMAAPKVAGADALLAHKFPHLKGSERVSILFQTATDLGEVGVDDVYGHGLLNIEKAMAPIGDLKLPSANTVQGVAVELKAITVSPQTAAIASASILDKSVAFDSYGRGYNVELTQTVAATEPSFDFDTYTFSQNKGLIMGVDSINKNFAVGYNFGDYSVAFTSTNDLFGMDDDTLSFGDASTQYMRFEHQENGWRTNVDVGYSHGGNVSNSLVTSFSDVVGIGAGVGWSDETWAFGVSSPIKIVSGSVDVSVPVGRDIEGNLLKESGTIDLSTVSRSWSAEVSYLTHPNKDDDLKFTFGVDEIDAEVMATYRVNF